MSVVTYLPNTQMPEPGSYFLGVDPDLHKTAIAVLDSDGRLIALGVCKIPQNHKEAEAAVYMIAYLRQATYEMCNLVKEHMRASTATSFRLYSAVEGQEIAYTGRSGCNPRDIMLLAHVSGAAAAYLMEACCFPLRFPTPAEWKGQVPKQIHQARICKQMGWEFEAKGSDPGRGYVVPMNSPVDSEGQIIRDFAVRHGFGAWKHAMDAVGLARWCWEQQREAATRQRAIAKAAG